MNYKCVCFEIFLGWMDCHKSLVHIMLWVYGVTYIQSVLKENWNIFLLVCMRIFLSFKIVFRLCSSQLYKHKKMGPLRWHYRLNIGHEGNVVGCSGFLKQINLNTCRCKSLVGWWSSFACLKAGFLGGGWQFLWVLPISFQRWGIHGIRMFLLFQKYGFCLVYE